jgi:hypothetical protein
MIGIGAVITLAVAASIYRSRSRYPDLSTWWNTEGMLVALIVWIILVARIFAH